jgi:hypothetical protein
MKKLFLMAAFAGLLGSSAVAGTFGDDKDKNKKSCCKKDAKACSSEKKEACAKVEKGCCKGKATASADKSTDTKVAEEKK